MAQEMLAKFHFTRSRNDRTATGEAVLYDNGTVIIQSQTLPELREHDLPFGKPIPIADFDAVYAYGNFILVLPIPLGSYSLHCRPGEYEIDEANNFIAALRS